MSTDPSPTNNSPNMALHGMGLGFGWVDEESARRLHPLARRGRQVPQRIEARLIAKITSVEAVEFFLDIIHKFWDAKLHNHGQRHIVYREKILKFCDRSTPSPMAWCYKGSSLESIAT